jgi:hypothetical protein
MTLCVCGGQGVSERESDNRRVGERDEFCGEQTAVGPVVLIESSIRWLLCVE